MASIKLNSLIPEALERLETIDANSLHDYLIKGRENHLYTKNYDIWAGYVIVSCLFTSAEICEMYKKYNCNDTHVTALGKAVAKKKGWI